MGEHEDSGLLAVGAGLPVDQGWSTAPKTSYPFPQRRVAGRVACTSHGDIRGLPVGELVLSEILFGPDRPNSFPRRCGPQPRQSERPRCRSRRSPHRGHPQGGGVRLKHILGCQDCSAESGTAPKALAVIIIPLISRVDEKWGD